MILNEISPRCSACVSGVPCRSNPARGCFSLLVLVFTCPLTVASEPVTSAILILCPNWRTGQAGSRLTGRLTGLVHIILISDPLKPAGLARNDQLMPSYSRARRGATGRFGYGEPPGVCLAPGYSISGPCPRGLLVPPGVRLGRIRLTLESVTGPGSLHNGSRPRGPRVRPQPAPGPGPRGTCKRTAPCPAQTRAPGRACDDP